MVTDMENSVVELKDRVSLPENRKREREREIKKFKKTEKRTTSVDLMHE